ncbi:MAG: hypothetical protein JWO90_153 [Solirubrobacterales bacterium]|nr:hypothetical protein [Solirubrobacterales bacterium]
MLLTEALGTTCAATGTADVPPASLVTVASSPTGTPQATDAPFSLRPFEG